MVVRPAFVLLALIAAAGCASQRHPQARPSASLVIPTPSPSPTGRPHLARPGAECGQVTTVTGGRATVQVVRGRTTCVEAIRVFEKYNDPDTPAEGTAGLVVIGHWTCGTKGTITTCASKIATIRTHP
ncbi:hypothetical protein [Actinoallomurus rhizosphaericola]|uniref:hypothetical protein n=1 Tax=Actinoallomurus rhizosphaericola TaxID=2952536 RepID=UPI002093FCC3|nr:hypothetical protein [Actinoallomurus rhizosphaericola]MCO5995153.1 hypothetical protein [Actinoallomurus rhizosphaericola]